MLPLALPGAAAVGLGHGGLSCLVDLSPQSYGSCTMPVSTLLLGGLSALAALAAASGSCNPSTSPYHPVRNVQVGPRPYYLVDDMDDGELKATLRSCADKHVRPSAFSIGHRGGGTLQIPEHSLESNLAGARMGAGVLECDVTFTRDRELVCRHSQCDLHTTTNIVAIPELNAKCTRPFSPAAGDDDPADALCCTSDITLAEYKTLCAKMDGANAAATSPEEYLVGTPGWRTDLYATCGTVLTHREHIALVDALGLQFTPELKTPQVEMPFEGDYTQEMYAQQMIDDYKSMHVSPDRVWAQSFLYDDILYWLDREPQFGRQAVYLDENGETPETFPDAVANLTAYKADGVRIVAPPLPYLVAVEGGRIVPSVYATTAKELGLDIITWTLERSGPLAGGGGYYYSSVAEVVDGDGDAMVVMDVLAREVGVLGIFSDWSGTVTYYANCFDIFP